MLSFDPKETEYQAPFPLVINASEVIFVGNSGCRKLTSVGIGDRKKVGKIN